MISNKYLVIFFFLVTNFTFSQAENNLERSKEKTIRSFKNLNFSPNNGFKGYYSNNFNILARKYNYKKKFKRTPYISELSLITMNTADVVAAFKIYLVEVDTNGNPSLQPLSKNYVVEAQIGRNETKLVLDDPILIPKNGFFVIIERFKENIVLGPSTASYEKGIVHKQPSFGLVYHSGARAETWSFDNQKWINPDKTYHFSPITNLAVNIKLIN